MANLNPLKWNLDQWQAAGRNFGSYAAGGITVAVGLHIFDPAEGTNITNHIQQIIEGVGKVAAGIAGLATTLYPIYSMWTAAKTASPSNQVETVVRNLAASPTTQASNAIDDPTSRNKIIAAVAEMPEVKKVVPQNPDLALAIPSSKVVPS